MNYSSLWNGGKYFLLCVLEWNLQLYSNSYNPVRWQNFSILPFKAVVFKAELCLDLSFIKVFCVGLKLMNSHLPVTSGCFPCTRLASLSLTPLCRAPGIWSKQNKWFNGRKWLVDKITLFNSSYHLSFSHTNLRQHFLNSILQLNLSNLVT